MKFLPAVLSLLIVAATAPSLSADILGRTVPGKWTEQLVPENEAEPYYPPYSEHDPLARAALQINAGLYRRALATLAPITSPQAALLRGQALAGLGRYEAALKVLTSDELETQLLRAEILGRLERYPDALGLLRRIIAAHPDSIPAHYDLGLYCERGGDYVQALAAYQWFADEPQNFLTQWRNHPRQFTSARDVVCIGKALDRWATLSGAYMKDQTLNNVILSMFTAAYQRIDTEYYPAHTAAAEYFLAHDDSNQAITELQGAVGGNPHDLEVRALVGKIAVEAFNFEATEQQISDIRDVDPDSIAADLLEARDLLQQRRPREALPALQAVLAARPKNIEALGLLAGAQALLLQDDDMRQTLRRADALQPASPVAYFEVAEQLGAMRQYPRAADMYKIALARAPWWAAVRNGLGLLMTQSGDEQGARVVLEAAHAADPFDVRAVNYLKLLDMMNGFARKETAHFIVTYDPKLDPVIPEYFSDYLESIYGKVTSDFHYEPKVKTLIEVFPTHDAFSVRTTGAPWIATVGASTGRVIALAAPRAGAGGTFNWSRVVRHEFTHTVTLGATNNLIQHWFTEGLAVWEEHSPLPWAWVPMLQDAVSNDKLFPIENLTWAFVRPKEPNDRQLAYAESLWICTYIEQKYGHQAILDLLDQCRQGHDINQMFTAALKENADQFFVEFQGWARQQVAGWGYDKKTSARYAELVAAADEQIKAEDYASAATQWEEIERLRPMDVLPHQRLMGIYLQLEDWPKAEDELETLSRVELEDNRYVKVLARLYAKTGKLDLACRRALTAVYMNPYDMAAHRLLLDLDRKAGDTAGAAREERVIPILQNWLAQTRDQTDNGRSPAPTAQ